MRDLVKQLGILAIWVTIIFVVIYLIAIRAREDGWRAIIPYFISDIRQYGVWNGGFNLIDIAKIVVFGFVIYFGFVNISNVVSEQMFPSSPVARRLDIAITRLAGLEENDVRCFQISPNCIAVYHSARAVLSPEWWRDAENQLEIPVGITFRRIDIRRSTNEVLIYFDYGDNKKASDILIDDGTGGFHVIKGDEGAYVYVIGDAKDINSCEVVKIGFAAQFKNIQERIDEAIRWKSPVRNLIAFMRVNSRADETAIHKRFDDYRIREDENGDRVGRELFVPTPEIVAWVKEIIAQQQT